MSGDQNVFLSKDELLRLLEPKNIQPATIQRLAYSILYAYGQFYWIKVTNRDGDDMIKNGNGETTSFATLSEARILANQSWITNQNDRVVIMRGDEAIEVIKEPMEIPAAQ